jgi:NodT family efflux transporter outer membrane factor (OMF) lipoprotein
MPAQTQRAKSTSIGPTIAGLTIALAATACAVGPRFSPPPPPAGDAYLPEPLRGATQATEAHGGEAQRFQFGRDLAGEWWTLFGSPQLDRLMHEAMAHYPDIAAQQAALRAARDNVAAQRGVFFPQVQGSANYQREKVSGASIGPGFSGFITSVYLATVNVSYTLDVFGGERRALEGLEAQAQAQRFQLEASYLTLMSNVASTTIQLASVVDQIRATREIIAIEDRQLDFIRRRFEAGSQTRADVLQQESNLALVRATLPGLEQQRAVAAHQLAVLTGKLPRDALPPELTLDDLRLPQQLPLSLPSSLVEQRPDIQQQEALLHQASAAVGVATANMLPQLTLSGAVGDETLVGSTLLQPGSGIWNVAAGISQPIFEGGALWAKRRAAIDTYDEVSAQYRLTVLKAFQNVADTLTALEHDAETFHAENDALHAADAGLHLVQQQYDAGAVNYASLLAAQLTFNQARLAYVQAQASRYLDTVTLFQALGGGWWNRS